MVVGCSLFTIIAIIVILKRFDSDYDDKQTIRTSCADPQEEKDLPDIQVESATSYMEKNEQIPRKIVL